MDESELEFWYLEEKDKVFQKYVEELKKDNPDRKKAERIYKEEIKIIRERYEKIYQESKKKSLIQRYSVSIKDFMDNLVKIYRE